MKAVPEFDGLRGYLATLVLVGHAYLPWIIWGWGSMDLFFCLSGILISTQIAHGRDRTGFWPNYIRRRLLRVWPSYYLLLVFAVAGAAMLSSMGFQSVEWPPWPGTVLDTLLISHIDLWFSTSGSADFFSNGYLPFLAHLWSVSLEEQFYILAPIICLVLLRCRHPPFIAALMAITMIICCTRARSSGIGWTLLPGRFDAFATGIFVGIFAFCCPHLARLSACRWIAAGVLTTSVLAITLLYLIVPWPDPTHFDGRHPLFVYGVACFACIAASLLYLIHAFSGHKALLVVRWAPAVALGKMSYSTYLWHYPTMWYLDRIFSHWPPLPDSVIICSKLALAYSVAYVAYVVVEKPMLRYRSRQTSHNFPLPVEQPN